MQSARCVRRKKLFIAYSSQLDHHTWNKKGQPLILGHPPFMHHSTAAILFVLVFVLSCMFLILAVVVVAAAVVVSVFLFTFSNLFNLVTFLCKNSNDVLFSIFGSIVLDPESLLLKAYFKVFDTFD